MNAIIYCRVSDPRQEENLSLPTQEKACRGYCEREGYDVGELFVDRGESAKTTSRPEFLRLLQYCRTHRGQVHAVVVYSLTRFSRNTLDHHTIAALLRGMGIVLRSVTEPIDDSPAGKLMETMLAGMAQFDNDVRAARTTAGMRAGVERGRWMWRAPLGYRNGVRGGPSLTMDPVRGPLIRQAFELRATGRTVPEMLQILTDAGLRTHGGEPIAKTTLETILHNRVYAGWIDSRRWKQSHRGDFEPIVSEELFLRVQHTLKRPDHALFAMERHVNDVHFPLRRFIRCATCQRPLTGSRSTGRAGRRYAFYHCKQGHLRTSASVLERAFLDVFDQMRPTEAYLDVLRAGVLKRWQHKGDETRAIRTRLKASLARHEERLRTLDRAWLFERRIDERTYYEQRTQLREAIALAQMELTHATVEEIDVQGTLDFAIHVLTHSAALWSSATVEGRQRLQWTLFPTGLSWNGQRVGNVVTSLSYYNLEPDRATNLEWRPKTPPSWNQISGWLQSMAALRAAVAA